MKKTVKTLIETAKRNDVKVDICGQGPSDYPDFARFLVEEGIDSISVTPDSIFKTIHAIAEIEHQLVNQNNIALMSYDRDIREPVFERGLLK